MTKGWFLVARLLLCLLVLSYFAWLVSGSVFALMSVRLNCCWTFLSSFTAFQIVMNITFAGVFVLLPAHIISHNV